MSASVPLLLAIDAGTGSCRAILFDTEGHEVAVGQREYVHPEVPGVPGSQAFETERNWELICQCVRESLVTAGATPDQVLAVSATSMREGMVLYDDADREIWACPNADSRAGEEVAQLVESGAADEIYAVAGDWVAITAPARFRWLAKHEPELFSQIAHVGMLGDWVVHRLSGVHATDPSLGSSSALFDLAQGEWSPRLLELCELDAAVCPPVRAPGTVVGGVTAAAAAATGLAPGTPVVVGGADTQLGLVGIGVAESGRFTLVGGTFWQLTSVWDRPLIDPERRLRTLCHSVPGQWMIEGIGFYSGHAMRWFRDAFCGNEMRTASRTGANVYAMLEREAADVPPGANGIFGLFSNLMDAKRWVHASPGFVGFDITQPQRSGRKECYRALQESAAYAAYGHLKIVEEVSGVAAEELVFTGGAANSPVWRRTVADVLGVPVRVPEVKESTALGAAVCAGIGAGVFADAADAAHVARFAEQVEPDAARHAAYTELYAQWRALYLRAMDLTEADVPRPLWRAAGT